MLNQNIFFPNMFVITNPLVNNLLQEIVSALRNLLSLRSLMEPLKLVFFFLLSTTTEKKWNVGEFIFLAFIIFHLYKTWILT